MHEAACVHGRGSAVRFVKLAHEMRCVCAQFAPKVRAGDAVRPCCAHIPYGRVRAARRQCRGICMCGAHVLPCTLRSLRVRSARGARDAIDHASV